MTDEAVGSQEGEQSVISEDKAKLLWKIVEDCAADLSDGEKYISYHLLMLYRDVLAESNEQLGRTSLVKHSIDTGDSHPVRLPR